MPEESIKKILITGNKGFIGSRLQLYLIKQGYEVSGLDRNSDITKEFNPKGKYDLIIHCAAEIGRIWGEENPYQMLETNILGTLNIIQYCIKNNVKLINFSTSEVSYPITNIYGLSKETAEKMTEHYAKNYGLKAISLRPFMIYGAGIIATQYKSALDRFIRAKLTDTEYEVHKDTVRSWLHVSDLIKAIEAIVKKYDFNEYKVFNIGSKDYRRMEDIAEMVGGKYKVIEPPKFLTSVKREDFSEIDNLGWEPKIKIEDGLKELFTWHNEY